jgi:hypothetical protein
MEASEPTMTAAHRRRAALSDRLLFDQRLLTQGEASRNKSRGGWGFLGYQPPRSPQANDKLRPTRRYSLHICEVGFGDSPRT